MTDVMKSNIIKAMTKQKKRVLKTVPICLQSIKSRVLLHWWFSCTWRPEKNHWGPVKFVLHRSPGPVKSFREFLALKNKHVSGTYLYLQVTEVIPSTPSPPHPPCYSQTVFSIQRVGYERELGNGLRCGTPVCDGGLNVSHVWLKL